MTHYFIDRKDARGLVRDEEGAEFYTVEHALNEAKASARDLLKQYADNRTPLEEACVEVRDVNDTVVAVLTVAEILNHPMHPAFKNDCDQEPAPGHR